MQLRYSTTLTKPSSEIPWKHKVTAMCFSPDNERFAIATADRIISIHNEHGERIDKFSTKPNGKGPKNYTIRGMQFCSVIGHPKLAVAQSDCIIFVYKWSPAVLNDKELNQRNEPSIWSGKKSICNKFPESSSVTSVVWPTKHPFEIVYGLSDGNIKMGYLRSNKSQTLHKTDSCVVSMTAHPQGNGVLSAHVDGSIYRISFPTKGVGAKCSKIINHSCPAYALAWGKSICAGGNDQKITFYDSEGREEKNFEYKKKKDKGPICKEFTAAAFNLTGDAVVIGNFDSFYTYSWNTSENTWLEKTIIVVEKMYSVTALSWKPNGSSLAVGTMCGLVDLYDACIRRYLYKNAFEITYVSPSQVLVRSKDDVNATPTHLKSSKGQEISKITIHKDPVLKTDRFVVARTNESLLLCDLDSPVTDISEIEWSSSDAKEKFIFDSPQACIINKAGELSVVEYGKNEILTSVRTEFTSGHLLSVRINERNLRRASMNNSLHQNTSENKKIAYLLDQQTICIKDMISLATTTINHDAGVDFIELNCRGNLLIFRDKKRILHLFDVDTQTRTTLLIYCNYVQWVPGSDVIVAQNRNNMCVWYNTKVPDQVTIREINGEIEGIERSSGKTEVLVDEGTSVTSYVLVEELIEFGTAIDDCDYARAMQILESMEYSPQSQAMWQQLQNECIQGWKLRLAERCAAALGDVSRARYLRRMAKLADAAKERGIDVRNNWQVRGKMLQLKKQFKHAEDVYLGHNQVEEAIKMYEELLMFSEAISVAERRNHPDVENKKKNFFQWLLDTKQNEQAAAMKEAEGDYIQTIELYLCAGLPGKAARVISDYGIVEPTNLLENVAIALQDADMYDKAGDVYDNMGQSQEALNSYIRGNAYQKAVELARHYFPDQVISLEEAWGDYRISNNEVDMAIDHYMEAHITTKAINAAIKFERWNKASTLVEQLNPDAAKPYCDQLALHYVSSKQYEEAKRFYIMANKYKEATSMFTEAGMWDKAHELARSYLSENEATSLYMEQANEMEERGRLNEAERLYLAVKMPDRAINMYKKHRHFDKMVSLVSKYRKDILNDTYVFVGKQFELEGNLREAEKHYSLAGDWLASVNMYRINDMWEEAIRVAKFQGGSDASKRVAYAYALHLGGGAGSKLLSKLDLLEPAIEFATESGAFEQAFELAKDSLPEKMLEIHYKHAIFLEDEERFSEAEEQFVKANKPKEAIDMYIHQRSWKDAIRIASQYDPSSVTDIYVSQAQSAIEEENFSRAEEMFIQAGKPEMALLMYRNISEWDEALRVAKLHLPHLSDEVNLAIHSARVEEGIGGTKIDYLNKGRILEKQHQYSEAIDAYLLPKPGIIEKIDDLEEIWKSAVRVAKSSCKSRYMEVVKVVSSRLVEVQKYESAAEILYDADKLDEAIDVAISGRCWEKARELSRDRRELALRVKNAIQEHMVENQDTNELIEMGHTQAALDILVQHGDWNKLWQVAEKEKIPSNALMKYSAIRIKSLLKQNDGEKLEEAVYTLLKYGAPDLSESFKMYQDLVHRILARDHQEEKDNNQVKIVSDLRRLLYNVGTKYRQHHSSDSIPPEFEDLLMAVHYTSMLYLCMQHGLDDLCEKCAIALLKYTEIIPSDKLFYVAGSLCRKQNHTNLAFMLLNRYIDLIEAIEEGNMSNIDNSDLAEATNIPFNTKLPTKQYLADEDTQEEIRDWVLSICMDSKIERSLPDAQEAEGTIYAGLFKTRGPSCIITGFPIDRLDIVETKHFKASRRDWNTLVAKTLTCPWTGGEASLK